MGKIPADWDHLQAAVVNLLRNAGESTPAGGQVLVSSLRDGDDVLIRVTDTGSGIAPELQSRIFEPYFTTKQSGSGLGLMITQRIVRAHGGEVVLESAPGRGLTLTIRLPRADRRVRFLKQENPEN